MDPVGRDHSSFEETPSISKKRHSFATELDHGMARTQNRFIAREIAAALGLHYVFAPFYLALNNGSDL